MTTATMTTPEKKKKKTFLYSVNVTDVYFSDEQLTAEFDLQIANMGQNVTVR